MVDAANANPKTKATFELSRDADLSDEEEDDIVSDNNDDPYDSAQDFSDENLNGDKRLLLAQ